MDKDGKVSLNREEAELVDEALGEFIDRVHGSAAEVAKVRALGFRVAVKLSQVIPWSSMLGDLPDWTLAILQRIYAPPAPPLKKTAAGKSAAGARRVAMKAPSRSPKARAAGSAAPAAGKAFGSSPDGAQDLDAQHAAINKSHRSAAEKAAAHRALNEAAGVR
ncbi:MAG: hypothetical protein AUI52_05455 [Acidobacteria bacterium 13_1_40CM_2_68_10]|nr:MAG: hypothetical protein AUI52_05455 [Acidobacteria bacterium 13_1_40CM_2_68_10]